MCLIAGRTEAKTRVVLVMRLPVSLFLSLILTCPLGAERPHVLFIAIDDLNDWIGCLRGHPQALTPHMDRLAARGILFTNAHCVAPACNPSRAAVFSGRMPEVTGVWSNQSGSLARRHPEARLLSTAFAESGYRTCGAGKLLHSRGGKSFGEYFGVSQRWSPLTKEAVKYTRKELPSKATANPRHLTRDSLGRKVALPLNRMPSDRKPTLTDGESFDWGGWEVPDTDFGDTRITDWAIGKLKERERDPLFLAVGYYRPHIPLWAPKRFFDRFKDDPGKLPPVKGGDLNDLGEMGRKWAREAVTAGSHATVVEYGQWQAAVEAYLACTTYVDYEIGRLLKALDQSAMGEDTWIILWSDHGWHLGEKEHWGKWTGWERSTRVPLIVVPPRAQAVEFAAGGLRCHQPVSLLDLYPTLVELCSLKGPGTLDGQSLEPLLREPSQSTGRVVTTTFDRGNISLRGERWRYIRYASGEEELYDLKADPNEWSNLASRPEHATTLKRFAARVSGED